MGSEGIELILNRINVLFKGSTEVRSEHEVTHFPPNFLTIAHFNFQNAAKTSKVTKPLILIEYNIIE